MEAILYARPLPETKEKSEDKFKFVLPVYTQPNNCDHLIYNYVKHKSVYSYQKMKYCICNNF
jgi:hypothetical protein